MRTQTSEPPSNPGRFTAFLPACGEEGGLGYYEFTFSPSSPLTSVLEFHQTVNSQLFNFSWQAGSGKNLVINSCVAQTGPTPPGNYRVNTHVDAQGDGNPVAGRAWHIWQHYQYPATQTGLLGAYCTPMGGTFRWDLMIHTEETAAHGLSCPPNLPIDHCFDDSSTPEDEDPYESDINNYQSLGCVKVSHADMGAVDHAWHNHGGQALWDLNHANTLLVVNDWPGYAG